MKKWNLIVDVANCTNCNVCALALQDEHVDNRFPGYAEKMPKHGHRWINILRRERGSAPATDVAYLPTMCQHCDDAPCIKAAPDAVHKRDDGIVIIDPDKAKGRRDLVNTCPYEAIWWNEERQVPQHWIFDAHLLDQGWEEPRCVTVCATNAIKSVNVSDEEMQRLVVDEQLETLRPELNSKPRVYYKNLWRYNRDFISGTLSGEVNGVLECIAEAKVELRKDNTSLALTTSDAFGDFKFDRLQAGDMEYQIRINAVGFAEITVQTQLDTSKYLGEIHLTKNTG